MDGSWFKRAWHSLKVAWVDTKSFFTCPDCGGDNYNLNDAWEYAGEQSAAV